MPPPIPEHVKRFTANPIRPGRYRPGKAVEEEDDSSEEVEEEPKPQQPSKPAKRPQARPKPPSRPLKDEQDDDDEEGFVTDEEDDIDGGAPIAGSTSKATLQDPGTAYPSASAQSSRLYTESSSGKSPVAEEDDESESEEESEEEDESSSEEEAPQRKFQRPTFIKKTDRKASSLGPNANESHENTPAANSSHHDEAITARRLAEAESLIKTTIERDIAARLAGKKSWDDDDDLPAEALVDDTDGLDPEAEHSAWRLREMHRLKRDREAMITREKELEEIERRRKLTAAEREAEDKEFIAKQREEKEEGRGKAGFLSKYHHKGAFFMDDETSERLAKRDLAGARFADDVADKSTLPEYMRIRDMTKLGKKGRTRYTDLKGQDTGRFGDDVKKWRGSGYENRDGTRTGDSRNLDERFLPDSDRRSGGPEVSGANASMVGERRVRRRSMSRSDDERHRRRRRSYSRSVSTSPPRKSRRQRSPSPYMERDKRKRVES